MHMILILKISIAIIRDPGNVHFPEVERFGKVLSKAIGRDCRGWPVFKEGRTPRQKIGRAFRRKDLGIGKPTVNSAPLETI